MSLLKIQKLTDTAKIPTRGSEEAAGFDLYADSIELPDGQIMTEGTKIMTRGSSVKIHTGLALAIPSGCVGLLFARSGLACKKGLRPANCVGVIDSDYRGEIIVQLYADIDAFEKKNGHAAVSVGDRIAQIMFIKYEAFAMEVFDKLDDTDRGQNGFGSTGTN